jgi:hypothetical protein
MSRIDSLPADQRAVLQLVLREGRRYDELSGLLEVDEAAVRERAHRAIAALAPAGAELPPQQRAEVADHLLGQQTDEDRAATRRFLDESPAGRAWARGVAGELRDLAGEQLPDIPGEPAGDTAAFGAPRRERARSPRRLGAALVLGALALVVIAIVLEVARSGGGEGPAAPTKATTQAARPQAPVEAQANLTPPAGQGGSRGAGIVFVQRRDGRRQIVAGVENLPRPAKGSAYGLWLYGGRGEPIWLGFFAKRDRQGRLFGGRALTAPIERHREVLVTRETRPKPPRPGPVVLRGPIRTASGG